MPRRAPAGAPSVAAARPASTGRGQAEGRGQAGRAKAPARAKGRGANGPYVAPPEALRKLGVTPRKSLGQHFLIDELVLGDIADACAVGPADTVLEIGAGPGGLTAELAKRAGRVVAVELDEELATLARRRTADVPGVCVLAADVLDFTPGELLAECDAAGPYVAVGNLPYYITQPVVRRLLEADPGPTRIVILVQREVARRMVGGTGRESLLSMSIKCYGTPAAVFDVPPSAFWPPPKVQSALVRIERLPENAAGLPRERLPRFFQLLRMGYTEPRKQLHNVLRVALGIPDAAMHPLLVAAGIGPEQRAQHLQLADWRRLFDVLERGHPRALDV